MKRYRSVLLAVMLAVGLLSQPTVAPLEAAEGDVVSLVVFDGGSVNALLDALGGDVVSVWASSGGGLRGYAVASPAFANAGFTSLFPSGLIPASYPFLVVTRAGSSPLDTWIGAGSAPVPPVTPTPTVTPTLSVTPTPSTTPTNSPAASATGPGAAESQFRVAGSIGAFRADSFLVQLNVSQSYSAGATPDQLEEVNICVGSATEVGDCYLIPPQLGEQRWYIPLPAPGVEGLVRLNLCTSSECGPTFSWGRVSLDASGAFYVVSDTYPGTFRFSVFALRENASYVEVVLDDGQSQRTQCSGIGNCFYHQFTSNAARATVTLAILGGTPTTSSFPAR